jgi:hypothetical protein
VLGRQESLQPSYVPQVEAENVEPIGQFVVGDPTECEELVQAGSERVKPELVVKIVG